MTPTTDAARLVSSFTDAATRVDTLMRLQALGEAALSAVREGLKHPDWHVRHWCAIYLDRGADPDTLKDLVRLLTDPEPTQSPANIARITRARSTWCRS